MPVKTTQEAIFGATAVFHLEGLCRAEALTVRLPWRHPQSLLCDLCNFWLLYMSHFRHKHNPRWIHAIVLQKRAWLWSQRAPRTFSGIHSIKWGSLKHSFNKLVVVSYVFTAVLMPLQIMQRGGLAAVRWAPPPACCLPTRAPTGCCRGRRYRPSTGGRTGLPNTDTASALPAALIYAPEERSALLTTLSLQRVGLVVL